MYYNIGKDKMGVIYLQDSLGFGGPGHNRMDLEETVQSAFTEQDS